MARSGLIFDPSVGLYSPDTSTIREGVAEDWVDAFAEPDAPELDTDPVTPAGQLIDAEVGEIEAKNAEVLYLSNMFDPRSSEGRWQDAIGYIYFLTRKIAEPTVVTCQLTGLNGTVIPYGALVQDDNGEYLICTRSVTIGATGTAETFFRCTNTGPIDVAAGSVNTIITVIPGWDTVSNTAAGAVGRDVETRSEFETRRYASVAANAHGSVSAIYGTIANIPGVLDVQVLENIGPDPVVKFGVTVPGHGITVCVYGGADGDIAEAIYRKKDNGCDTGGNTPVSYLAADYHNALYTFLILRPTTINFWVQVTLGGTAAETDASVIERLKQSIFQDFNGQNTTTGNPRVGLASTVYASRFFAAATAVDRVDNIVSIGIALSSGAPSSYANVVNIQGDQEPVLSVNNISVVFAE